MPDRVVMTQWLAVPSGLLVIWADGRLARVLARPTPALAWVSWPDGLVGRVAHDPYAWVPLIDPDPLPILRAALGAGVRRVDG